MDHVILIVVLLNGFFHNVNTNVQLYINELPAHIPYNWASNNIPSYPNTDPTSLVYQVDDPNAGYVFTDYNWNRLYPRQNTGGSGILGRSSGQNSLNGQAVYSDAYVPRKIVPVTSSGGEYRLFSSQNFNNPPSFLAYSPSSYYTSQPEMTYSMNPYESSEVSYIPYSENPTPLVQLVPYVLIRDIFPYYTVSKPPTTPLHLTQKFIPTTTTAKTTLSHSLTKESLKNDVKTNLTMVVIDPSSE